MAKERAEEEKTAQMRAHAQELKRQEELLRERQAEGERLRLELAQLQEREESRKKMSLLEDEARARDLA
jgi:hypothetical protein